jgi:hypothetical protein
MSLSQIAGVMIFTSGRPDLAGRHFYVTRIWLEREAKAKLRCALCRVAAH